MALFIFLVCCISAGTLSGQTRNDYQKVYQEWQQGDPSLERDAASAGDKLTPRTEAAALKVGKFVAARRAFYDAQRTEISAKVKASEPLDLPLEDDGVKTAEAYLAPQETSIGNTIELFGGDSDPGIRQLRDALEKERQALIALQIAIRTQENAMDSANEANDSADHASERAEQQMQAIAGSFVQSAENADHLAEVWPAYYRALDEGARGLVVADPTVSSETGLSNSEQGATVSAGLAGVPKLRYGGSWNFEFGVSTYTGLSPFSFELLVWEAGGEISGTVDAHFINGNADAIVRFGFSGSLQETRVQSFVFQTKEGATGTVELTPGTAHNLLEVHFRFDGATGKVRESRVVLAKH